MSLNRSIRPEDATVEQKSELSFSCDAYVI